MAVLVKLIRLVVSVVLDMVSVAAVDQVLPIYCSTVSSDPVLPVPRLPLVQKTTLVGLFRVGDSMRSPVESNLTDLGDKPELESVV